MTYFICLLLNQNTVHLLVYALWQNHRSVQCTIHSLVVVYYFALWLPVFVPELDFPKLFYCWLRTKSVFRQASLCEYTANPNLCKKYVVQLLLKQASETQAYLHKMTEDEFFLQIYDMTYWIEILRSCIIHADDDQQEHSWGKHRSWTSRCILQVVYTMICKVTGIQSY